MRYNLGTPTDWLCNGASSHIVLCLSFLLCKMRTVAVPTAGVIVRTELLQEKHLEQRTVGALSGSAVTDVRIFSYNQCLVID